MSKDAVLMDVIEYFITEITVKITDESSQR